MIVRLVPRAQVEAAWREHERAQALARQADARPDVVMAEETAALVDRRELIFRGRGYVVPPVPFPLAAKLLAAQEKFRQVSTRTDVSPTETVALFLRTVSLFRLAAQPKGRIRRALWSITPNPFRKATPREVGELLGFFCVFLTLDGSAQSRRSPAPGTSPRPGPGSRAPSRRGPARTATRSAGGTS